MKENGISEGVLLVLLHKIPAKRMVLLFQACFSGALVPDFGPEEIESENLPESTADAILGSGEGRIIITSTREGQKSWGRYGEKNSIFGRALVNGLRGEGWLRKNAGYIGAFGLYEYVYETVKDPAQEIDQAQEPVLTVLQGVGPFRMGEGKEAHTIDLSAFWLAQYLVINAQYNAFAAARGYAEARWSR